MNQIKLTKVLDRAEVLLIEESLKEDGDSLAFELLDEVREVRSNPDLDALRELAGGLMMVWEEQTGNEQLDRLITDLYSTIDGE